MFVLITFKVLQLAILNVILFVYILLCSCQCQCIMIVYSDSLCERIGKWEVKKSNRSRRPTGL
jgi:hypothetical protein